MAPLSSNAVSSLQPNDLTSSPRPRHTNFLRVINGAIEESLTIINTNQLGTIFENSLRQEFEGLPELVTHLQGALKTSLQQSVQQTFNEFQLIEKLSSLDSKINKAKKNNFTFPNNFENLMSNPVLIDLEVQYEAYSSALDELNKQLKQSEDKLMNEKIQYQLKIKEWETLSAQRNMKELEIEKILSPALALDFSIIEESLSL
ncbi:hypothetical protein HMI55_000507 [Coelomomyces lativittatus]|nr:hypothetical protein HMI55_000507 [Coelomomyces lativittatus]